LKGIVEVQSLSLLLPGYDESGFVLPYVPTIIYCLTTNTKQ
jgi:hypothetical protein